MTAPTWERHDWIDPFGEVQHEQRRERDAVYVATLPSTSAQEREPDWRASVCIEIDHPDRFASADIPCDVLAEALRARGWKVEAP